MQGLRPFLLFLSLLLWMSRTANPYKDRWQFLMVPMWQRRHRIHLLGLFVMLQSLRHPFLQLLDARAVAQMSGQKFRRLLTVRRLRRPLPERDGFAGAQLVCIALGSWVPVVLEWALLAGAPAFAESPSVTVQWGGLAFTDQASTVVGGPVHRFTEFDNPSLASLRHESSLNEILGLNLVSINWTKQWDCSICQGITTNVTAGAVLTPEEPSRLQTDIRHMLAMSQSRSAGIENENSIDGMGAFVNKVFSVQRNGNGVAFGTSFVRPGGTLSKDLFEREGVRGLSLPFDVGLPERFSLMGRVSMTQQFMSLSYRYEGVKVESWNQTAYSHPARGDLGLAVAYTVVFDGKGWAKCGFIHCH